MVCTMDTINVQLLHIILVMYNACFKKNNAQQCFWENGGYGGIYRNMDVLYFITLNDNGKIMAFA